ncbi:hypothetical protein Glove_219g192 [Diversispora epigaea]|uniref:Endonuclease/exonuclease/phosphatase domain-containing protein n=1 Tax=Diversispora epigaea TaxID=1348612 RepID=A0A397IIS8_9GLOM|nr:hypothetical protein Glove_219g192 [Diversispora epigaea]
MEKTITNQGNKETEYKESVKTWKIATQNIKGLKDKMKQNLFWNQCIKSNLDIIFIQETNIKKETKEFFFSHTYSTQTKEKYLINEPENYQTWILSLDEENKKSGHGVAISIKKEIALHIFKVKELKGYALQLLLSFKGKYIVQLITVYNPPQITENATIRLKLKNWIIENINEGKSKNWYSILGGDWNITLNPERNRKTTQEVSISATNKRKPQNSILNHIKFMGYRDAYELLNDKNKETEEKHFTCIKTNENYTSMSRIDAIWVDRDIIPKVKNANQRPKKFWNTKLTDKDQWDLYTNEIEEKIKEINEKKEKTNNEKGKLETKWNTLKQIIIKATNNNITKAKIPKNRTTKNNYYKLNIVQAVNKLSRTIRKTKKEKEKMGKI